MIGLGRLAWLIFEGLVSGSAGTCAVIEDLGLLDRL